MKIQTRLSLSLAAGIGLAILASIAEGDLDEVRAWGRSTVASLAKLHDRLLVPNEPRESLMRFHVLRRTFFDFEATAVSQLHDGEVRLKVSYHMSPLAEEAACHQTMGFFEGLVTLAGGEKVRAHLPDQSWQGAPCTTLVVAWNPPRPR